MTWKKICCLMLYHIAPGLMWSETQSSPQCSVSLCWSTPAGRLAPVRQRRFHIVMCCSVSLAVYIPGSCYPWRTQLGPGQESGLLLQLWSSSWLHSHLQTCPQVQSIHAYKIKYALVLLTIWWLKVVMHISFNSWKCKGDLLCFFTKSWFCFWGLLE